MASPTVGVAPSPAPVAPSFRQKQFDRTLENGSRPSAAAVSSTMRLPWKMLLSSATATEPRLTAVSLRKNTPLATSTEEKESAVRPTSATRSNTTLTTSTPTLAVIDTPTEDPINVTLESRAPSAPLIATAAALSSSGSISVRAVSTPRTSTPLGKSRFPT